MVLRIFELKLRDRSSVSLLRVESSVFVIPVTETKIDVTSSRTLLATRT